MNLKIYLLTKRLKIKIILSFQDKISWEVFFQKVYVPNSFKWFETAKDSITLKRLIDNISNLKSNLANVEFMEKYYNLRPVIAIESGEKCIQ